MRSRVAPCLFAVAILVAACAEDGGPSRPVDALSADALTVGSFNFGESVLLAELYAQAIEAHGIRVVREFDLGPRELLEPALERGLLELVPEYAGSLLAFLADGTSPTNLAQTRSGLDAALAGRGLVALASAAAQDQNGFAVTLATARELGVRTLSDLAGEPGLVLGGPPECPQRPLCERGLHDTYGIEFGSFVSLDQGGPLTTDALAHGVVDVALMFTTSAEIVRNGFVLLEDDRHLQPAEHVTPIVRRDALARFGPELAGVVDAVSALLTTEELRTLNARVEIDGQKPADAAHAWLGAHGLIPGAG